MADGVSVPRPSAVIWATGFRPSLDHIDGVPLDADSLPDAPRDVVASIPGLFFVEISFKFGLTSPLLGGMGQDAGWV